MRHMQSQNESKYDAANEWLQSLGDDLDDSLQEVYVGDAYSPSQYNGNCDDAGMEATPHSGSTHAGIF